MEGLGAVGGGCPVAEIQSHPKLGESLMIEYRREQNILSHAPPTLKFGVSGTEVTCTAPQWVN